MEFGPKTADKNELPKTRGSHSLKVQEFVQGPRLDHRRSKDGPKRPETVQKRLQTAKKDLKKREKSEKSRKKGLKSAKKAEKH